LQETDGVLNAALSKDLAGLDEAQNKTNFAANFEWFRPLLHRIVKRSKTTQVNKLVEDIDKILLTECVVVSKEALEPFFKPIDN